MKSRFGDMNLPARRVAVDAYLNGGLIVENSRASKPQVVVVGDSYGVMWSHTIRAIVEENDLSASFYSANGVSPFVELPLNTVSASAFWFSKGYFIISPKKNGLHRKVEARCRFALSTLEGSIVRYCSEVVFFSEHCGTVLLMESPPASSEDFVSNYRQYLIEKGASPKDGACHFRCCTDENDEAGPVIISRIAESFENVGIVRLHDLYRRGEGTLVLDGDECIYVDASHLTQFGADLAKDRIESAILKSIR
ncbi:SGNH hydrolase domain-containing protein [Rubripirellula sp.]|nr:SGNH hydrolase domain-containing protein [Rubripirellula sp.]